MPNPFMADFPGVCSSCGFLGQYQTAMGTGAHLFEVAARTRDEGSIPSHNKIWCLRRAANLQQDYLDALQEVIDSGEIHYSPDNQIRAAYRRVFQRGRGENGVCPSWHEWVEYFDPTWHYEDWRMTTLEEMRQANALKMAEIDRAILEEQTKIAGEHAKTAEALLKLSERSDAESTRVNTRIIGLTRLGIAIAVASVVLALGSIVFPNGIDGVSSIGPHSDEPLRVIQVTPTPLSVPSIVPAPESR